MRAGRALMVASLGLAIAERAPAAPPDQSASPRGEEPDRYEYVVHSETYAELFRRALLPGPDGAGVAPDAVGAGLGAGIAVEGDGGFTVLPRWNRKPGYHELGAATDTLLRAPDALPEPSRSGNVLGGARIGWSSAPANVALSFHEQHEDLG